MTLFDRVKEISKQKGYTLAELAERAGIGEKSMYTWKPSANFPDGVTPKRATLEKVADALGVSVDYLLGNTDETMPNNSTNKSQPAELSDILSDEGIAMFDGQPLSDEYKRALLAMLRANRGK